MTPREIAKATLGILDAGGYRAPGGSWVALAEAQAEAVAGTRVCSPPELAFLVKPSATEASGTEPATGIDLQDATTQVAAEVAARTGARVALLNFASAKNPGGGFLSGARAQEEDLCRCSGLYRCLSGSAARPYYTFNRARAGHLYSDTMVFSPRVPFFRRCSRPGDLGFLLEEAFLADVVTAPAPNAGATRKKQRAGRALGEALARRADYVLTLAAHEGAEVLVLGAWGCGVFRNDPNQVAETFFTLLEGKHRRRFQRVVFAVPRAAGPRNYEAFERRLNQCKTAGKCRPL